MKIKEQTRKLAVGCSKHCFEVVDETDEVSSKHGLRLWIKLTKSAQNMF
ncbi:chlorohydrolase [Streptococcus pneumoniae]|nr:chlorohydrolase [Streptococcus pneumoniae]